MTAALEVDRVTRHIVRAEQLASTRDLSHLSRLQRILRQLLLRVLAEYRAGGRFPINRDFAEQRPYFVDASGTRCAMAHLLEHGGEHELVAKIARERNNAYVRELADESRLLAWLAAAGLTVEEAAAIQPSYCSTNSSCICGGDFSSIEYPVPAVGVLEAVVTSIEARTARVERIYGNAMGIAVGSEIELTAGHFEGTVVLVPLDASFVEPFGSIAIEDGTYNCSSQGVGNAPPITLDELQQVLLAADCPAALAEVDERWDSNSCDGAGQIDSSTCNASSGDAGSVAILLALAAVLVRRR